MYFVYSLLLGSAMVLAIPWWLLQMARQAKYRAGLKQRLGAVPEYLKTASQPVIWIHAVSVGEVLAVSTLVQRLRERHPEYRIVVSTTTATGNKLALERFGAENTFFFPLDFGFAIRPYLRALRPKLVILAETEFWPNFLRHAKQSGAKIAVVNARISDRSFPRYRRWHPIFRRVLQPVDAFLAQSDEDARRLTAIGAESRRVGVGGNLKFEVSAKPDLDIVDRLRSAFEKGGAQPILVAGSTVEGEEPLLLKACEEVRMKFPQLGVVLAPRHRERFEAAARIVAASPFTLVKRSQWNGEPLPPGTVFLLDTIGELASLYSLANIAFVGGSLVERGGHNILEPAQHGAPIVIGPHYENFRDIIRLFQQADAVSIVEPPALGAEFVRLLSDSIGRTMGKRAAGVIEAQSGATDRTLQAVEDLLAVTP